MALIDRLAKKIQDLERRIEILEYYIPSYMTLDGGDAFTATWDRYFDGGTASTASWDTTINGGSA